MPKFATLIAPVPQYNVIHSVLHAPRFSLGQVLISTGDIPRTGHIGAATRALDISDGHVDIVKGIVRCLAFRFGPLRRPGIILIVLQDGIPNRPSGRLSSFGNIDTLAIGGGSRIRIGSSIHARQLLRLYFGLLLLGPPQPFRNRHGSQKPPLFRCLLLLLDLVRVGIGQWHGSSFLAATQIVKNTERILVAVRCPA